MVRENFKIIILEICKFEQNAEQAYIHNVHGDGKCYKKKKKYHLGNFE